MREITKSIDRYATAFAIWPASIDILAAGAFLSTMMSAPTWLQVTLVSATVLGIAYRTRRGILRTSLGVGPLAQYMVARYLLLAAVTTLLFFGDKLAGVAVTAVVLLALAMAGERVLRSLNAHAAPYVENFPGVLTRDLAKFRYAYVFVTDLLALVALAVSAFTSVDLRAVALVIIAVSLLLLVAASLDSVGRVNARKRFERDITQHLTDYSPQFYLHWHAPVGTTYQVEMWLPYLERLGVPFAIVVRSVGNFRELSRITQIPIIYRKTLEQLDPLIVPSLRGVFYVNTATRNDHMVRYAHLVHIQLNHGDSDKVPSFNPVFRMYDFDFVAGQAAIDRFAANNVSMPPEMFRIVGRPQVEGVRRAERAIGEIVNPTVLYAPTWGGFYEDSNYSSVIAGVAIVQELVSRGATVIFRPHPYTNRNPELKAARREIEEFLDQDRKQSRRQHVFGTVATSEMSVVDCFNAADAMISDVSSVVGDFLYSGKPLAMVSTRTGRIQFENDFPMARAAYVMEAEGRSVSNLVSVLDAMLGTDPKEAERERLAEYYLGDIHRENYADLFIDAARSELGIDATVQETSLRPSS